MAICVKGVRCIVNSIIGDGAVKFRGAGTNNIDISSRMFGNHVEKLFGRVELKADYKLGGYRKGRVDKVVLIDIYEIGKREVLKIVVVVWYDESWISIAS